jgi:hypothetical protein
MTSKFKIEKAIPVPAIDRKQRTIYPFREMEVGDSFFVKDGDVKRIGGSARQSGHHHNRKYATRKVEGGVRVWRVE